MPRPYLWKYSLFNCFTGFESPLICLQGWFCPCWLYGDNNHVFRQEGCCGPCCCGFFCCPCLLPVNAGGLRTEIRHKYNIQRGPVPDWMVHTFCCSCGWCQEAKEMQGQPVGQYNPPPEIQPKTKQQKKRAEMTVPETQVVASGRLASASEAESGQLATGVAEEGDRTADESAVRLHGMAHACTANNEDPAQAGIGSKKKLLASSSSSAQLAPENRSGAADLNGLNPLPRKLATIVSGESAPATPSAEEMQKLDTQV